LIFDIRSTKTLAAFDFYAPNVRCGVRIPKAIDLPQCAEATWLRV
jgi:hypothetical protein